MLSAINEMRKNKKYNIIDKISLGISMTLILFRQFEN